MAIKPRRKFKLEFKAKVTGFQQPLAKREMQKIYPPEEVANAIKETLSYQISLPFDELVKEISRIFGFASSGTNVELAMKRGISKALGNGYVLERDGRIIFKEPIPNKL